MIKEFFEKMWELEEQGIDAVLAGDLTQARRIARKLKDYPDEQYTLNLRIKLANMLNKGEYHEAVERAHQILSYKWGDMFALLVLRIDNPEINANCKIFEIDIHAGVPCLTPLGGFSSAYTATFVVVAETQEAALKYIGGVCRVSKTDKLIINRMTLLNGDSQAGDRQGVYSCSPFSKITDMV